MYEFHPSGIVDFSPGAIVDMPWRIEAEELVLPSDTVNGPERRQIVRWLSPNKLQMIDHSSLTELTRAGGTGDIGNPILGEWTGIEDMGGRKLEFHWFFYPAGKGLFLLSFVIQHGRYTISGSTLTMQMNGKSSGNMRFELRDNILTLMKMDGSDQTRFALY